MPPSPPISRNDESPGRRLAEVAGVFVRLGLVGFGGPAAHAGLMHEEVVRRRRWVDEQRFLDLLGATNLIPGPNSTELAIHLGHLRAGWMGLVAGGACFILPAMALVLLFARLYVLYGSTPTARWLLVGIQPVIIAIIVRALWDLGRKALKDSSTRIAGGAVLGLYLAGVNEIGLLFGAGAALMLAGLRPGKGSAPGSPALLPWTAGPLAAVPAAAPAAVAFGLPVLFLTFLKIGTVLYGSGYVLLAFLRADFVVRLGWLTDRQLLDAVAVGQVTPGPLFTTATFIGYLLGGLPGALLATLGIFLPAFVLVALTRPLLGRMRAWRPLAGFLDGVNAASVALMAGVALQLGRVSLVDPIAGALGLAAAIVLFATRLNPTWLILGGGMAGLIRGIWP